MTNPFKSPVHSEQQQSTTPGPQSTARLRVPAIVIGVLFLPVFLLSAHTSAIRGGDYLDGTVFVIAAILCVASTALAFCKRIAVSWVALVIAIFLSLVPALFL